MQSVRTALFHSCIWRMIPLACWAKSFLLLVDTMDAERMSFSNGLNPILSMI